MPVGFVKFKTAEELQAAIDKYFDWCKSNPRRGTRTIRKADEVVTVDEQLPRPYTIEGLSNFLHVADWLQFEQDNRKRGEEFERIFKQTRSIIRQDQIEGALIGQYKENLTARINGISDTMQLAEVPKSIIVKEYPDEE